MSGQERFVSIEAAYQGVLDCAHGQLSDPLQHGDGYCRQGQPPAMVVRAIHGIDDEARVTGQGYLRICPAKRAIKFWIGLQLRTPAALVGSAIKL